ncbi:CDP-alcohol phosphatidyltransferase family protein [Candidatus Woesearchaeota archaeon]|nr:CDP-alcohol phosphatidyltransferase family protein [Candidatus Woesearchaeota archaeon]
MVTYASVVVGVSSAVVIAFSLKLSAALLAVSFILDGVDGSLARYTQKSNNAGSVTDGFCDQIVVTATAMGFVGVGLLNPLLAMAYVAMYPVVVLFTIIQKKMHIETMYTLRPRLLVYTAFFIFVLSGKNLLNPLLIGVSLLLTYYTIRDFIKIRRGLKYG